MNWVNVVEVLEPVIIVDNINRSHVYGRSSLTVIEVRSDPPTAPTLTVLRMGWMLVSSTRSTTSSTSSPTTVFSSQTPGPAGVTGHTGSYG